MTYFDNSATTNYKPDCVIRAVSSCLKYLSANPGRSGHTLALRAALLVSRTRELAAKTFGTSPDRMIFTSGCTASLNTAIFGSTKIGGNVITTAYEHNSVLRPLFALSKRGQISVTVLRPNEDGVVTREMIAAAITPKTYLVATNHISNVTGAITPVESIGSLCKKNNLLYLVDAAQSAGYGDISLIDQNIDMLAIAPHKGLHAPQGIGLLALSEKARVSPLFHGGTGTFSESVYQPEELPESLESGTLPTPLIGGLNAAINFTEKNKNDIRKKLNMLSIHLVEKLQRVKKVTIYSSTKMPSSVIAFNIAALPSSFVSRVLNEEYDICTRPGLHCAPLIHRHLGTLNQGIVRVSLGYENTFAEIDFFIKAVEQIASLE